MNRTLIALTAAIAIMTASLAAPTTAHATDSGVAATWSCSAIQTQYMEFETGTPWHEAPLGSSRVLAWGGSWQSITASCVNSYGSQWWRTNASTYRYAWDGYRIG